MQKKLIATAVAGLLSASAYAAPTLYGVADVYLGQISTKSSETASSANTTVINSGGQNGSRLGVKGSEDLGGVKAIYNLEYGLSADQAGSGSRGIGFSRKQQVGLAGGFGSVVLGGIQSAGFIHGLTSVSYTHLTLPTKRIV